MKTNRPFVALGLVVLLVAAFAGRWEKWDYQDARGGSVFQYRGLLLPWQQAVAPPAGVNVVTVTVRKRTALGPNRFDYAGTPGGLAQVSGTALRAPGR